MNWYSNNIHTIRIGISRGILSQTPLNSLIGAFAFGTKTGMTNYLFEYMLSWLTLGKQSDRNYA